MKRWPFFVWAIGAAAILLLLYLTILRYPGYIFHWDLSGAFDFRAPFDQYTYIYTPWDAINVGIKNRLPIASVIYLIYLPLKTLGLAGPMDVVKIALTLLFLGSYTSFYVLFPRWFPLLLGDRSKARLESKTFLILRLLLSLVYPFIPYFAYRIFQLHLFYESVFYPIHIYLFLRLLLATKFEPRLIMAFVISLFFGLATPHLLVFDLITFAVLFCGIAPVPSVRRYWRVHVKNFAVAIIGVVLTNVYWLVPYVLVGSPSPGYVLTDDVIEMLSQAGTLKNFIFGQSEWFITQNNITAISDQGGPYFYMQILGLIFFYVIALWAFAKKIKRNLLVPILLILLVPFVLNVKQLPYQQEFFHSIIYSPLGWVFREPAKVILLWGFWVFLLFGIGLADSVTRRWSRTLSRWTVVFWGVLIVVLVGGTFAQVNITFWKYIKPLDPDDSIIEVFTLLKDDPDFFYTLYLPAREGFRIPWKEETIPTADLVDYNFLEYNSPKPPVHINTILPHGKVVKTYISEYMYKNNVSGKQSGQLYDAIGVKYVVINKTAKAIWIDQEVAQAILIQPRIDYFSGSDSFDVVLENEHYIVYENNEFNGGVGSFNRSLHLTGGLGLLEHIWESDLVDTRLVFCQSPEMVDECRDTSGDKVYVHDLDDGLFYLGLLPEDVRNRYTVYPYDQTRQYGLSVDWGRAAFFDQWNGELHSVLNAYGIQSWEFDVFNKAAYSDIPYVQPGKTSTLSFSQEVACRNNCDVYAYVLKNHLGGELQFSVGDAERSIHLKSDEDRFQWVQIAESRVFPDGVVSFELTNTDGFAAVGGILVIPHELTVSLAQEVYDYNRVVEVSEGQAAIFPAVEPACEILQSDYNKGFISTVSVRSYCTRESSLYLKAFENHLISYNDREKSIDDRLFTRVAKGSSSVDMYMITYYDLLLWVLYAIDVIYILMAIRYVLGRKNAQR